MKKRILSAFLCLCMMLTLAPAAFAEGAEGDTTTPSTGDNNPDMGGDTGEDNKPQDTLKDTIKVTFAEEGETATLTANAEADADADGKLVITLSGSVDEKNFADGKQIGIILTITPAAGGEATTYTGKLSLNETLNKVIFTADPSTNENKLPDTYSKVIEETGIKLNVPTSPITPDWAPAPTVQAAKLVDHSDNPIADTDLVTGYKVNAAEAVATTTKSEYTQEVTITGAGLKEHENANHQKGYWIGFEVTAPENTSLIKYQFDGKEAGQTEPEDVVTGKGIAFYFNMKNLPATKKTTCWAEFCKTETVSTDGNTYLPIVKVSYDVDMTGVEYEGEEKEDSVSFHFASSNQDVAINACIDGKVIKLSGNVNASMFVDDKGNDQKVAGKLEYSIGESQNKTYAILLSLKDGKLTYEKDPAGGTEEALPVGYSLDLSEISVKAADVPENVETKAPVGTVSDAITDKADKDKAQEIASSVATDKTEDIVNAAATELTNIVQQEAVKETEKVVVFLAVEAKEYEKDDDENVKSVKLDITPKYQVVSKADGSEIPGKTAKDLKVTAPITLTVTLPTNFKDATNVFAKHLNDNDTVKDVYKVAMAGITGTFTTEGFSEFEFTKDERRVTVKYNGNTKTDESSYTLADISKELATDTKEGYTFKGWALKENATTADYSGTLTETMLDAMIEAAKGNTLNLYPVFETKSSSNTTTSGGGGGNKRPSSGNDNTSTGTTPPSNYGDNPTTPSTPSTPASKTGFSDVVAGGWYESAVQYMKDNGLMAGTSATTFAPDATTTRGMIVTILYRLEKEPAAAAASSFSDIAAGEWYSDAVAWAAANNIVSGYENGTFGAGDVITREQMAAILFRYASFKGYDVTKTADLSSFADAAQVSAYAADAMKWANAAGLISGTSTTTLAPAGSATRAQAASILMRFCENVAK